MIFYKIIINLLFGKQYTKKYNFFSLLAAKNYRDIKNINILLI